MNDDTDSLLTQSERDEIALARSKGMASYFPAIPSAEAQEANTLRAARKFLKHAPSNCGLCANGTAHAHGFPSTEES